MKRWLFNLAAGASLLLCVGTIILWIACRYLTGFKPFNIPGTGGKYALLLTDGRIALCRVAQNSTLSLHRLYFLYLGPGPVPLWVLILIFLALPVIYLAFRRRIPAGHCTNCGYDLRATPERCPECGRIPDSQEVASK